jgi:hypothetical protein
MTVQSTLLTRTTRRHPQKVSMNIPFCNLSCCPHTTLSEVNISAKALREPIHSHHELSINPLDSEYPVTKMNASTDAAEKVCACTCTKYIFTSTCMNLGLNYISPKFTHQGWVVQNSVSTILALIQLDKLVTTFLLNNRALEN